MSYFGLGLISANGVPGNDSFTKILLHMDGSNGGTSFPDANAGGSAHTWTPTSATTSTSAAKFGPSSMLGAAGYITTPAHADFNIGANDFTADLWFNNNGLAGAGYGLCGQSDSAGNIGTQSFFLSRGGGAGVITAYAVNAAASAVASWTGTTGFAGTSNWNHVALTKAGNSLRLFVNGVQEGATQSLVGINSSTRPFTVGRAGDQSTGSSVFLDEFRLSVGIARWTANFTPPASQYI